MRPVMAEEQVPEWFETAQRREQMKAEVRDLHALIFCTLRSIDRTEREAGRPLPSGSVIPQVCGRLRDGNTLTKQMQNDIVVEEQIQREKRRRRSS